MAPRELILLSPYRLPAQHPLTLANDDMAAWLNGYSALWHPAALWQATSPPRVDSPYDHETPRAGHVYAVPESPPSLLPDDWEERVRTAGAVAFRATADRATTLANLLAALRGFGAGRIENPSDAAEHAEATTRLVETHAATVAAFLGIGLGYMLLAALSEAMEHENLLESNDFWNDLQRAVAAAVGLPAPVLASPRTASEVPDDFFANTLGPHEGPPPGAETSDADGAARVEPPASEPQPVTWETHVQSAALRLLSAREMLYPVTIHLLDLFFLDEHRLKDPWPASFTSGQPVNVIASGSMLESLQRENPESLADLAQRLQGEEAEVCGGGYLEREEALLPIESQLWNLSKGLAVSRALLGGEVRIFARRRFGAHPQLPLLLHQHGITKAVMVQFDDSSGLPTYTGAVVTWAGQDTRQIDCFVRKPFAVDSIDNFFNLGHHLFKTTREDQTATLAFVHGQGAAQPWYQDLLELSRWGPIAGQWTTFSRYFSEATAGEHIGALAADEFHFDYLSERVPQEATPADPGGYTATTVCRSYPATLPVSGFARQVRVRRRLDTCWTLAALQRGLAGRNDSLRIDKPLNNLEDLLEKFGADAAPPEPLARLANLEQQITSSLAERLLSRAQDHQPGYLLLNPCSFTRRLALELDGRGLPIPLADPVKACQVDGDKLRVVAEVPPLGFAWFPQTGPPGTPPPATRMRLADERMVRNEFFEAEIDPATGGLRALRDHKTMVNRIAERLIFRPGSVMKATQVKTTSTGPALGEIVTEGALLGAQSQVLAKFRQRFRAWLGRPILDLRIELYPEQPPAGYPWHAYYGAQFAWRDERGVLLRGINGTGYITTHTRPQTPDYLELRLMRQSTTIFPGGLPFHQREGGRMLDVLLVPAGEPGQVFDLAIGLDREQPMQTALGLVTPATVVPTTKGPPHVGAKGWLFHLDASNLLLTSLRPGGLELDPEGSAPRDLMDAVTARLLECSGFSTPAEFRCVRNPQRVALLDARGQFLMEGTSSGDAALFHVGPGDMVQLQMQFSL
jgi:hypothetical protein